MQELGKFNFKINVIPNGLGQHMSFSINDNLRFIDSFQFLSFLLNSSVKKLMFDNKVFDLVKKKIFYLYEYMNDFERFKEQSPS